MDIILVSSRFAKARTISLSGTNLLIAVALALFLLLLATLALQYAIVRFKPDMLNKDVRVWLSSVHAESQRQQQSYLRDGLNAMAIRLGQMQAQLARLDALGLRLAKLGGMKPQEFNFEQMPAQGGPYIPSERQNLSLPGMSQQMNQLSALLSDRSDKLAVLETLILQDSLDQKMFPSVAPIKGGWHSSDFGMRIDPFTGEYAMHQGVDFVAEGGTPVYASANGIVVHAGIQSQYGNMVEIDHGNDIVTRYGHASRILVKVGQLVRRGQEIAKVGSTGRSTGNHLHFEVRFKGVAQNPVRFLENAAG